MPLFNLTTTTASSAQAASVSITPAEGTISVVAPRGALPVGTTITLGNLAFPETLVRAAPLPGGAQLVLGFVVQATSGSGTAVTGEFAQPVSIEVVVLAASIPGTAPQQTLVLAFWDGTAWLETPATISVRPDGSALVQAQVTHFTVFAILLRSGPPLPQAPRAQWSGAPAPSGFSLLVWNGSSGTAVAAAVSTLGVVPAAVWAIEPGTQRFLTYIPGAPAIVNDLAALTSGQVVIVRVGRDLPASTGAPPATVGTPSAATPSVAQTYVVTATDTLSGIGARFQVDWLRIAEANNIAGPGYIVRAGQVLTIPRPAGAVPAATPASASPPAGTPSVAQTYIVTATDTLSGIGARFQVDWLRIAEANNIAGPGYIIRAGQMLTIPRTTP